MSMFRKLSGCAAMVAAACVSAAEPPQQLEFTVVQVAGRYAPATPQYAVIRSAKQWKQLQASSQIRGPEVNFGKFLVVVVATGQKPTSGYSASIARVVDAQVEGDFGGQRATTVEVLDQGPGNCPSLQTLDRPQAVFALIPKINPGAIFKVYKVLADCSHGGAAFETVIPIEVG